MKSVVVNDKKLVRGETPIIYLSGMYGTSHEFEKIWLKRTGCKYRCFSFAYTCPGAFYYRNRMHEALDLCVSKGCGIMMDSSAHSFHNFVNHHSGPSVKIGSKKRKRSHENIEQLRDETIELYIKYVKEQHKNWDFYVNFDYVKHCPTIYKVQHQLQSAGIFPVPSYHGDDSLDWLRKYIDEGHKLIGLGLSNNYPTWRDKMRFYDRVFNLTEKHGVYLHGFAVTSLTLMFAYPWFSVDSSTWVKVAAYGKIITIDTDRKVISQFHVSPRASEKTRRSFNRMQPETRHLLKQQVEQFGFDFDKVRNDINERCTYNGYLFSHMHEFKIKAGVERAKWQGLI